MENTAGGNHGGLASTGGGAAAVLDYQQQECRNVWKSTDRKGHPPQQYREKGRKRLEFLQRLHSALLFLRGDRILHKVNVLLHHGNKPLNM